MIYLLDYLNMIYLRAGFFESETEALRWARENDPEQASFYSAIPVARGNFEGRYLKYPHKKYRIQS